MWIGLAGDATLGAMSEPNERAERMQLYATTQARYAERPRESDRVLIEMMAERGVTAGSTVVDVACSTGNLLRHIGRRWPGIALTGRDLSEEALTVARSDGDLVGIGFERADLLQPSTGPTFDVVIANAVLYQFRDADYGLALAGLAALTRPGGLVFAFDWYHDWEQDLTITEKTPLDPDGMTIVCKSFRTATRLYAEAGFDRVTFHPYAIPVDLPKPVDPRDNRSYTVKTESGSRLTFRGGLYQPWCHVVARKP